MRIARYYSNSDIRIEEAPLPKIGKGELLVRVEASGICGSDVMEWYRVGRVPLVLGHEIAGTIEEVGEGLSGYSKGERIAASHHVPCETCSYCKAGHETVCDTLRSTNFDPGGFAEFLRLPQINVEKGLYKLPKGISFEEATFIEPLACVLRGQRVAGMKPGLSVLVVGSGIAGLLHVALARASGAGQVAATDISDYRLNAAKRLGADFVFQARDYKADKLFDLVVICTGAPSAIEQAFDSVERAGTVLFFAPADKDAGVSLPVNKLFWRAERKLVSSYAGSPKDHLEALKLIESGKVKVKEMITHRLPLARITEGFKLVSEAKDSIKVIIEPQQ